MSFHGQTKGSKLEKMVRMGAQAEINGTLMYYALARIAAEQGLDDVADTLIKAGNQEAVHAGFYAVLNGQYPKDLWNTLRGIQKAEEFGESRVLAFAEQMRAEGFTEAAGVMEVFAREEAHHGVMMKELIEKHRPRAADVRDRTVSVCPVCGFEYAGDLDAEPEDYACPVCGMPKKTFTRKA